MRLCDFSMESCYVEGSSRSVSWCVGSGCGEYSGEAWPQGWSGVHRRSRGSYPRQGYGPHAVKGVPADAGEGGGGTRCGVPAWSSHRWQGGQGDEQAEGGQGQGQGGRPDRQEAWSPARLEEQASLGSQGGRPDRQEAWSPGWLEEQAEGCRPRRPGRKYGRSRSCRWGIGLSPGRGFGRSRPGPGPGRSSGLRSRHGSGPG